MDEQHVRNIAAAIHHPRTWIIALLAAWCVYGLLP